MKFKIKLFLKTKSGQGILEVVVAISVITVALVAIINLAIFNINVQGYNHNMLVASNLARESIEVVRNIRDSNWLDATKNWDDSLVVNPDTDQDHEENTFVIHNQSSEQHSFDYDIYSVGASWNTCFIKNYTFYRLYFRSVIASSGHKLYNNFLNFLSIDNEASNFYRLIYINPICWNGNNEIILNHYGDICDNHAGYEKVGMEVISKVAWKQKGDFKTLEVEDRLYNWK